MHVMVIGASGMIGRKLLARMVADGLDGASISRLTLADVIEPVPPQGHAGDELCLTAGIADPVMARRLAAKRPDAIFYLAAVVSGEAEADFEKGYRINLDGPRNLLEAVPAEALAQPWRPRFVFTSLLAVFGAPLPDVIGDEHCITPLTSYGTQKALAELLISGYLRRGFIDGVAIPLPAICIRPGAVVGRMRGDASHRGHRGASPRLSLLPVGSG
jgi:D-erythronate 2-dehydrogenase